MARFVLAVILLVALLVDGSLSFMGWFGNSGKKPSGRRSVIKDRLGLSSKGNGQDQSNIMDDRTLERILATKRPSGINRYSKLALLRRIHDLDVER
ncbi:hypothetical protein ABFA07_011885 [Porites harrisoni]